MSLRLTRRCLAACLLGLTALAAAAQPVSVRDDRGTEHTLAAPPQRIVTMLPSLTESAWALGVGQRLVGVDRYSSWPEDIARLPHLGGLDDAQIEAIAALRPDVILASTASRAMERLEALGFTVVYLKAETHADVRRTLEVIARLLGTPQAAGRVWADISRQIDAAAARVPARMRGQTVYFEVGGGPYAAGTSSFIGETLARLGLVNIIPATLGPFPKLNPEFVVRAHPDLIMGVRSEQAALLQRPGWSALAAVRHQRLCGFDAAQYDTLVRPGPRMGTAASWVADCLVRLSATP
ncbi:ABC transporter substrate-binding protein [Amphibiibacter pelophylacis]|uniref:Helical backbone metal receptor n=1 Tax=Amphibiibacter pelophylacis TaxID=1799477 RepID=A0ACC6NZ65_9BURK